MKGKLNRFAAVLWGSLFFLGWLAATHAAGPDKPGRVTLPVVKIENGDKCVELTPEMRRNHMKMLLHQRDKTVHQGIRTTQHSLKNCVDCHASPKTNSVLGKDGFCESCHNYASVSMDCFGCHSSAPRKQAAGAMPAAAYPSMSEQMGYARATPGRQPALVVGQKGAR